MTRHYPDQITPRTMAAAVALTAFAIAALLGITHWLLPQARQLAPLPAPASGDDERPPGAVVCPAAHELPPVGAVDVTASLLVDCPRLFDGRTVSYTGEAIRAIFERAGRPVVVLNDDPYALEAGPLPATRTALGGNSGLAVLLPEGFDTQITQLGSYNAHGDRIHVVGTYSRAADALGGEPAILASTARIVAHGTTIEHPVPPRNLIAAATAITLAVVTGITRRMAKR